MVASSVTGIGGGAVNSITTGQLLALAKSPSILFTGITNVSGDELASPPTYSNNVILPYKLEGGADNYVIMLTSLNAGNVYIADRQEDDDGNLVSFTVIAAAEGSVMYMVSKVGQRPIIG